MVNRGRGNSNKVAKQGTCGAVVLEGALTIPIVTFLLIGFLDILRAGLALGALHYTVATSQRWAVLNQTLSDPDSGQPLSRVASITRKVIDTGKTVGLSLEAGDIEVCQLEATQCVPQNAGAPNSLVRISASSRLQTFVIGIVQGSRQVTLTAQGIRKNEPEFS